jgi:hypothetical protein
MKRFTHFALSLLSIVAMYALPAHASAEAAEPPSNQTRVTLSQTILPPSCYDTVSNLSGTTDYIAVFDCPYQRD